MPFDIAARSLLTTLQRGSAEHAILDYLLTSALGRKNARSWDKIKARCSKVGVSITKKKFQQGFLAKTRDDTAFIGASNRGYFIIQDRDDAREMAKFYEARIRRETEHLDHLKSLVLTRKWPPI